MQLVNNDLNDRFPLDLFHIGENYQAYKYMGAHRAVVDGQEGVVFRTWAPNAKSVSVVGAAPPGIAGAHQKPDRRPVALFQVVGVMGQDQVLAVTGSLSGPEGLQEYEYL